MLIIDIIQKAAEFRIRIFEGDSWRENSKYSDKVRNPTEFSSIDIYAGFGKTSQMKANYRHLVWKNTADLRIIKPNQKFGIIDHWGPIFTFKFKLYVSEFPKKKDTVSIYYLHIQGEMQSSDKTFYIFNYLYIY